MRTRDERPAVYVRLDDEVLQRLRILAVLRRTSAQKLTEKWIRDGLAAAERKEDVS